MRQRRASAVESRFWIIENNGLTHTPSLLGPTGAGDHQQPFDSTQYGWAVGALAGQLGVAGAPFTWKNNVGAGPFSWSDSTQWLGAVAPTGAATDQLIFGDGTVASYTATIDAAHAPWTVNNLTFVNLASVTGTIASTNTGGLSLAGSAPSITQNGPGPVVISALIQLTIANAAADGSGTGTMSWTGGLMLASSVTLDKSSPGTLEIDGPATFGDGSSSLQIDAGVLRLNATTGLRPTIGRGCDHHNRQRRDARISRFHLGARRIVGKFGWVDRRY